MSYIFPSSKKQAIFFCNTILVLMMISFLSTAQAHRINLFCRAKQQKIVCSSSYSDGTALKDAQIKVFSQKNNEQILTGKTNQNGKFSFDISEELQQKKPDLKISVAESMGHKDTWIIRAEEYIQNKKTSKTGSNTDDKTKNNKETHSNVEHENISGMTNTQKRELKKMVKETVANELQPLESKIEKLMEYKNNHSFRDIFGGIGYIIGIMGILFFVKGRKKRS